MDSGIKRRREIENNIHNDDEYIIYDMTDFLRACIKKDLSIIRDFIDNKKIDINYTDFADSNIVMNLINYEQYDIALELLENFDFDHSIINIMNDTILSLLLSKKLDIKSEIFKNLFEIILSKKCNINHAINKHKDYFYNIVLVYTKTIINYTYEIIKDFSTNYKTFNILLLELIGSIDLCDLVMNNIISGNFIKDVKLIYEIQKNKNVSNEIISILINSDIRNNPIDSNRITNWFQNKEIFKLIVINKEFNIISREYIVLHYLFYHMMYNEALTFIEENKENKENIEKVLKNGKFIDGICVNAKTNPLCIEIIKKIYDIGIHYIKSDKIHYYYGYDCNFNVIGILIYHLGDDYNKYITDEYLINFYNKKNNHNIISIFTYLDKKEDAIKFANLGVDYKYVKIMHTEWFDNLAKIKNDKTNEDDTMGTINKDQLILEIQRRQSELTKMIAKLSVIN